MTEAKKTARVSVQARFDREAQRSLWLIDHYRGFNFGARAIPDREFDEFLNGGVNAERFRAPCTVDGS